MFFEKIDYLSPKITLFYKYKKRHSSSIGGLLTSIMVIICIAFIFKFLFALFLHSSPSVIFYRKYEKDLSKYSFDASSISHLIWLNNNNDSLKSKINTKAIRVILLSEESDYNANSSNLKNYEHWIYDSCRKNDFNNLEDIIFNDEYIKNSDNIENAICLRYYYNKTEKKYYSLNNDSFKYPFLEHGISNKKNKILATIVEKCTNNSITNFIFGDCENDENIQKYIRDINSVYIQILDHQVDLTNYNIPIQSYFMGISSFLQYNNGYEVKQINFSPLLIRSNQNIISNDDYIEKNTVIVDNTQSTIIGYNNDNKILIKYLYCIQNYKQIYERKYNDIFSVFSSIGGIIQFFYYVFYLINYFYNDFILILNTQNLFLNDPKNKKITKLIPFNRKNDGEFKYRNNTLVKNYESSNYLNELQNYKLYSKDNKFNNNDEDISSIQLSESNNDKDSRFLFNRKKEDNILITKRPRRSQQLNYKNILKFKLKDEHRKKAYRNSMFNPKNTVIFSPMYKMAENKGKNFTYLISSNRDYSNIEENNGFESSNNVSNNVSNNISNNNISNNNISNNNFNNNNIFEDSKKITFIDNRDKNFSSNKNNNLFKKNNLKISFADNVKISNYLKKKNKTIKPDNKIFFPEKNKKLELKKTIVDCPKEKYYKEKLNFKEYIRFRCSVKNKRRDILIIQRFRKKLLSEEHFFKSHLFIYLIIQKIKIDKDNNKSDIKDLYSEL